MWNNSFERISLLFQHDIESNLKVPTGISICFLHIFIELSVALFSKYFTNGKIYKFGNISRKKLKKSETF